jgi:predicted dehydrogenase
MNPLTRRHFLGTTGAAGAALALAPRFTFATEPASERKIRVGIVGGRFGASFHFHEHPNCTVEAISDLRADRRARLMKLSPQAKSYESLELLLRDSKVEAVFVATGAPDHARHVLACLDAGKHVLCAVPAAMNLEECGQLRDAVKRTGLTYMMAETSVWRQDTISVKQLYREGKFGRIFGADSHYYHPGLETLFFEDGKWTWRHGLPPMLYPTHCTAFLIAVTGERLTSVSCVGWGDDSPILKNNPYRNPFWNESAFFQTNRGTAFRVEVAWKGALREAERADWRGEKMSFHSPIQGGKEAYLVRAGEQMGRDDGGFVHKKSMVEVYQQPQWWKTDLLPEKLRHDSGHGGSHTFITHEFIDAIVRNRAPEVNIHEALAYTVPGIVAHESALKGGEQLKIPSFDA